MTDTTPDTAMPAEIASLVERLLAIDEATMYERPATTRATIERAATALADYERMQSENKMLRKALEEIAAPAIFFLSRKDAIRMRDTARAALEPAAPESEPRPMTGFFSNLSPEGQAAALAYDGPEPNIGDTAPEGQQEPVAHAYVVNGECEQIEWGTDVDLPDDPALVLLYTHPTERTVTEAMVEAAAKAVVAEWKKMTAETSPHMSPGDHARAFVSPGNYRLIRAALKAAMEVSDA